MATVEPPALHEEIEQRLDLRGIGWDRYVTISDALPDRRGLRLIYLDGSLTFLTLSRRHDWYVENVAQIVTAVAFHCGLRWNIAGSATFRLEGLGAGVEGDRTYYFGDHAAQMSGNRNIDLTTQPPPDLAIEVEVTHPADQAMATYARIGVPEVWRISPARGGVGFWSLGEAGTYETIAWSKSLPMLSDRDILGQLILADEIPEYADWFGQMQRWVRDVIVPRVGQEH